MVDPLTALGTASAIITLVEFSSKILTNTKAIYQSATGQNDDTIVLAIVARDVGILGDAITASSWTDNNMNDLVYTSQEIARDLLQAIDKLKVKGDKTVWKSFRLALKDVWTKRKLESFSQRLATLQAQVASHIQLLLLVSEISLAIHKLDEGHQRLRLATSSGLQDLRNDVLSAIDEVMPDESMSEAAIKKQRRLYTTNGTFSQHSTDTFTTALHHLSQSMRQLLDAGQSTASAQDLMGSLYFRALRNRKSKICQAHTATFSWIFDCSKYTTEPITFVDFLKGKGDLFWIRGKPGSGKSTLMKFLSVHQETRRCLRDWAGSRKLSIASCFFWYAGCHLQKSQEGLLRSLLFEILRQNPNLIPRVHDLLAQMDDYNGRDWSWTCTDLLHVCQKLIESSPDIAFSFFIDGLDEYEEDKMAPADLIRTIGQISSLSNVRMCVSSRPWAVFTDAFNRYPGLKLEELTRGDILRYVTDYFHDSVAFRQVKDTNSFYAALPTKVCNQAQGVFLWVYLVVRDLLDGLTHGETAKTLLNRLDSFPEDLNEFFQHMVDTIQPTYLKQAARALDVTMSSEQPLPMIVYSFLDEIETDSCPDALHEYFSLKVDVIHRTVFEFLHTSISIQSLIKSQAADPSTPILLCRAFAAAINRAPSTSGEFLVSDLFESLCLFAAKAEKNAKDCDDIVNLLNSAQQAFDRGNRAGNWGVEGSYFLGQACRAGVFCYTGIELSGPNAGFWIKDQKHRPLLDYVLSRKEGISVEMVGALLKAGADPNARLKEATTWAYFMGLVQKQEDFRSQPGIIEIIELMVANGADLQATVAYPFLLWPPAGPAPEERHIKRAPVLHMMTGRGVQVLNPLAEEVIKLYFTEQSRRRIWRLGI
ncbi:hypothetical protein FAVG1_10935 [Fusarium avenaceum]|nr:hypothetical protein FAVG1_10935 [Fusarium avenaceum]